MNPPTPKRIALLWYRSGAEFEAYARLCSDGATFHSYEVWEHLAEMKADQLQKAGVIVRKIERDAEVFAAWCEVHARARDAESRMAFAAHEAFREGAQGS